MTGLMGDLELDLVIEACRPASFGQPAQLQLPDARIDWNRLAMLSRRHRVQGVCWQGLQPLGRHIPAEIADRLRSDAEAIARANLLIAAESTRLLRLFRSAEVDLLFLKGLSLAALAYRDPYWKMGWDIDLLVSIEQLAQVATLLRCAGYLPHIPEAADDRQLARWHSTHKESVWRTAKGDFFIDLHTRLADNPEMLRGVGLASPRQVAMLGNGVELPTLGPDELFAYLAVHGASSAWFRLKWVVDLAALLSAKAGAEIEQLFERSQQLGAGRAAAQALLLVNRLFAVDLGRRLPAQLESDAMNRALAKIAGREIDRFAEPTERPLGTMMIHLSQLMMKPGIRFAMSEANRQLRDVVARSRN